MYDQQDAEMDGVTRAMRDLEAEKVGWRRSVARSSNQKGRLSRRPEGGDSWRSVFVRSSPPATWYRRSSDRLRLGAISSSGHAGLVGGRTCRVVTIRSARIFGNRLKHAFVNGGVSSSSVALTLSRGLRRNREHAKHCRRSNKAQAQAIHSFSPSLLQGRWFACVVIGSPLLYPITPLK